MNKNLCNRAKTSHTRNIFLLGKEREREKETLKTMKTQVKMRVNIMENNERHKYSRIS